MSSPPSPLPLQRTQRGRPIFAGSQAFGIDLGRLERALSLQAVPLGGLRFEISGGEDRHYVDLSPTAPCPCDCGDMIWRGGPSDGPCKHMLRARLALGDANVILAVAVLVGALHEHIVTLERRLRPKPIRVTKTVKIQVAAALRRPVSTLTFTRDPTSADATVFVELGTTGLRLGSLVRTPAGTEFIPHETPLTAMVA